MTEDFTARLDAELRAACADAGVDPRSVRLFCIDADPLKEDAPSVHYRVGHVIHPDEDDLLAGEALCDANMPESLSVHRIAVCVGGAEADPVRFGIVAGLLRHEVEHARQYDDLNAAKLKELDTIADVIALHLDGPSGNTAYRSKPTELAANGVAANFVAERHPDVVAALAAGKFSPFTRPGKPVSPAVVGRLTVEWIREREAVADDADLFDDGLAWDERLDEAWPGSSVWATSAG